VFSVEVPDDCLSPGQASKIDAATERSIQRSNSRKSCASDLGEGGGGDVSYAVAGAAVAAAFAVGFLTSCRVIAK